MDQLLIVVHAIYNLLMSVFNPVITTTPDAFVLTTSPQKILAKNPHRVIQNLQNQESVANIFTRYGGDGTPRSYFWMQPGSTKIQDVWCPTEELWAYSDTAGAILTIESRSKG